MIQEQVSFFIPESCAVVKIVKTNIAAEKSSLSAVWSVPATLISVRDLIQSTVLTVD